jgi:hypothetical protein
LIQSTSGPDLVVAEAMILFANCASGMNVIFTSTFGYSFLKAATCVFASMNVEPVCGSYVQKFRVAFVAVVTGWADFLAELPEHPVTATNKELTAATAQTTRRDFVVMHSSASIKTASGRITGETNVESFIYTGDGRAVPRLSALVVRAYLHVACHTSS